MGVYELTFFDLKPQSRLYEFLVQIKVMDFSFDLVSDKSIPKSKIQKTPKVISNSKFQDTVTFFIIFKTFIRSAKTMVQVLLMMSSYYFNYRTL